MPRGRASNKSGMQPRKRKDGRWEVRYAAGIDGRTGKTILKSIYGKTSAEVAEKLREVTASVDAGTYIEPQRMTLAKWLDVWTQEYCGDVKPGTLDDYKGHIENHIKPALGAIRLCELQPHDVQRFANALKSKVSSRQASRFHPRPLKTSYRARFAMRFPKPCAYAICPITLRRIAFCKKAPRRKYGLWRAKKSRNSCRLSKAIPRNRCFISP